MSVQIITAADLGDDFIIDPTDDRNPIRLRLDGATLVRDAARGGVLTARGPVPVDLHWFFATSPGNGHVQYRLLRGPVRFTPAALIAQTLGTAPGAVQVYTLYDGATAFAAVSFATNGSTAVSMIATEYEVTGGSVRLAGPATANGAHSAFAILLSGILA